MLTDIAKSLSSYKEIWALLYLYSLPRDISEQAILLPLSIYTNSTGKSRQGNCEALGELPFSNWDAKMDLHKFAVGKYVANM